MKYLFLVFAVLAVSSCVTTAPPTVLKSTFMASQAAFIHQSGTASIEGQAFLRRNDGIVIYAAGSDVALVPKTAYSEERFRAIFKGQKITRQNTQFTTPNSDYNDYKRQTIANGEGRFSFMGLAPGEYYVATSVLWVVAGVTQGGVLMEEIRLAKGQSANVIMTGQ